MIPLVTKQIPLVTTVVAADDEINKNQNISQTLPVLPIDVGSFLELNKECCNVEEEIE